MKRILRFVFWILVTAGIVYAGYYAYDRWLNDETPARISDKVTIVGKEAGQKANEYAKTVASTTKNAVSSFIKNQISELASDVGEKLYSFLPASSQVQSIPRIPAGNVSAPTSSAFDVPPSPATIVVNVNESISFSINSGQVYKINWGDGEKEQGAMESGNIKVLRHSWASAGDYIVRISIGNSVSSSIYSFPIRVYPPT